MHSLSKIAMKTSGNFSVEIHIYKNKYNLDGNSFINKIFEYEINVKFLIQYFIKQTIQRNGG